MTSSTCWPRRSSGWAPRRRPTRQRGWRSCSCRMPTASLMPLTACGSISTMAQFRLPDLGEGLEEAQVVEWLVQVGDTVQLNQPLCQVETAKALVDIPSPFAGEVRALHARPGDTVPVGAPLITIAVTGEVAQSSRSTGSSTTADEGRGPVLVGYGTAGP